MLSKLQFDLLRNIKKKNFALFEKEVYDLKKFELYENIINCTVKVILENLEIFIKDKNVKDYYYNLKKELSIKTDNNIFMNVYFGNSFACLIYDDDYLKIPPLLMEFKECLSAEDLIILLKAMIELIFLQPVNKKNMEKKVCSLLSKELFDDKSIIKEIEEYEINMEVKKNV